MEKVKVELEVAKETYELGVGVRKFVGVLRQALKDGFQPGQDLPVVLVSAVADLVPSVQGVEKVGGEVVGDVEAFADALYIPLKGLAFDFVKNRS